MKKIANIYYRDSLVNHNEVGYVNYSSEEEFESNNKDGKLPTLIVGWKLLNSLSLVNNYKPSILDKCINESELYWEFSFNENKSQHITGIEMFVRNAPIYYFSTLYTYNLIDPVYKNITSKDQIPIFFNESNADAIYIHRNKMIYILMNYQIFGIDIEMYEFFEIFNVKDYLLNNLNIANSNHIFDDLKGDMFAEYNKIFLGYDDLERYLVVLLSK